jgi:hypothetical protein
MKVRQLTAAEVLQLRKVDQLTFRTERMAAANIDPESPEARRLADEVAAFLQRPMEPALLLCEPREISDWWLELSYKPQSLSDVRALPKELRQTAINVLLSLYADGQNICLDGETDFIYDHPEFAQTLLRNKELETPEQIIEAICAARAEMIADQPGGCPGCGRPIEAGQGWLSETTASGNVYWHAIESCIPERMQFLLTDNEEPSTDDLKEAER